ncbi:hypothetical protein G6F35_013212 [Rhizopus arrhizus]|nr:hypothetical protein G6F35_013212 [Rhizopus arrhizus]
MNFHEYQSKQLLAEYGIPVPAGKVAATPDEAVAAANSLGQGPWMVKAQIHAGGRGRCGQDARHQDGHLPDRRR